jgi:fatty-acyl-CoA synthase
MDYPLTTTTILEYGNSVYRNKKNNNLFTRWKKNIVLVICINDKLANALTIRINNGDMVGTFVESCTTCRVVYGISGIGLFVILNIRLTSHQTEYIINNLKTE